MSRIDQSDDRDRASRHRHVASREVRAVRTTGSPRSQALETKPAEVAGQALFVTNSLEEQETSVAQYRAALLRRRRLPPPAVIDIGKFVSA